MNLNDTVSNAMKEAMKAGRKLELETLRTLRAAILEFQKRGSGVDLSEEDELAILNSAAKKRKEAIAQYREAGRDDLADREQAELEIIRVFLPAQLGEEEVEKLVQAVIEETGAGSMQDFGKVMGPVMKQLQGRFDGAAVQAIVRRVLGG